MKGVNGVKYTETEENYTSGGEHTKEYTDVILESYTPEIYILALTDITQINLI